MVKALNPNEVEAKLKKLPLEWSVISGNTLVREFTFSDFDEAIAFVNSVARVAKNHNHHPDIEISWAKVTLTLTSHSLSALTNADFKLAHSIETVRR